jgi:tripartite-type tricarboxylate transporter receptor subunit TctC
LKDEDTRKAIIQFGVDVFGGTPQELADYVKSEIPKWAEIIKASGTNLD